MEISPHDYLVNELGRKYPLPPRTCVYCEMTIAFPEGNAATERSVDSFRPDISIRSQGNLIAVIEVIDKHPPDEAKLSAQEKLPDAYYFHVNGHFWCTPWCWKNQDNPRLCPMPVCEACGTLIYTVGFGTHGLVDWESPGGELCLECAARISDGQWRSPGELALGDPEDRLPDSDATPVELFLSFSDADFWAMVWTKRTATLTQARTPETETAARLDLVEAAFESGDWNSGQRLLQPIGAPAWDRSAEGPILFAWEHENCVRTAMAWRKLRAYRLQCLPMSIQVCIRSRPALDNVVTEVGQIVITHRGFPDGRYTACGIDRQRNRGFLRTSMDGEPTCPECRLLS